MVIYLDIGFNSLRKKRIFFLYFLMVCLQLRLPNNLSTPAGLGAGAEENAGVGSLEDVTALRLTGRYGKLPSYRQGPVTLVTVSRPSLWKWDPPVLSREGSSPGGTAVHSSAVPATRLCSAWVTTYLLEQSAGLATASSRKALGSASSPCSYVHWVFWSAPYS